MKPLLLHLLHLLLVCLALAPAPRARAQQPAQRPPLKELLRQVQEQEDRVDARVFAWIADHGGAPALRTLKLAVRELRNEGRLNQAYAAFERLAADERLRAQALDFLADEALGNRREQNQRAAARALSRCEPLEAALLERVFERAREESVKRVVLQPLVPVLGARGTPAAAETILDYADVRRGEGEQAAFRALSACTGEAVDALLARRLLDAGTDARWRVLLIDVLAMRQGREAGRALVGALDDAAPEVRTRAIEALGERGDPALARRIEPHLRADDEAELRQAVITLGQLSGADERWVEELFGLAGSARLGARLGAAVALLELRTPEAVDLLHELLCDPEWQVRAEALQQVGNLRRPASVPALVARLDQESGRLRRDVATVLRLLTGEDHGLSARRWEAWWRDRDADYRLPPYEQALAAERERAQRREENVTVASFYGLEVVSDRVCFVVDVSGSMRARAGSEGRTASGAGEIGPTRLDVAREELEKTLTRLSPGVLFNVVFFDSQVFPWSDALAVRDDDTLTAALEFARRQKPGSATNVYGGLSAAFEDPRVDTVYLLSDGDPTAGEVVEPELILERVARRNRVRKVQIHCISIGKPSAFLRRLAEQNGGVYAESR